MSLRHPSSHSCVELTLATGHCAGCRRAVVEELRLEGIAHVEIDGGSGRACITFDTDVIDAAAIVARLTEAGYPPLANPHDVDPTEATH